MKLSWKAWWFTSTQGKYWKMTRIFIVNNPLYAEHTIDANWLNKLPVNGSIFEMLSVQEHLDNINYNNGSCCFISQETETNNIPKKLEIDWGPALGGAISSDLLYDILTYRRQKEERKIYYAAT